MAVHPVKRQRGAGVSVHLALPTVDPELVPAALNRPERSVCIYKLQYKVSESFSKGSTRKDALSSLVKSQLGCISQTYANGHLVMDLYVLGPTRRSPGSVMILPRSSMYLVTKTLAFITPPSQNSVHFRTALHCPLVGKRKLSGVDAESISTGAAVTVVTAAKATEKMLKSFMSAWLCQYS